METAKQQRVNVAPSSTEGHFVENAENVVDLDNVTESFVVEGESKLVTANHTTLKLDAPKTHISVQMNYNPFAQMFEKSRD